MGRRSFPYFILIGVISTIVGVIGLIQSMVVIMRHEALSIIWVLLVLLFVLLDVLLLDLSLVLDIVPVERDVFGNRLFVVSCDRLADLFEDLVDSLDTDDFELEKPVAFT